MKKTALSLLLWVCAAPFHMVAGSTGIELTPGNVSGSASLVIDGKKTHSIKLSTEDIDRPLVLKGIAKLALMPMVGGQATYIFKKIEAQATLNEFLKLLHVHKLPYRVMYHIAQLNIRKGRQQKTLRDVRFMSFRGFDWLFFIYTNKNQTSSFLFFGKASKNIWHLVKRTVCSSNERSRMLQYANYQLIADWLVCQTALQKEENALRAIAQFLDHPKISYTVGRRGKATTLCVNLWRKHNLPNEAVPSAASIVAVRQLVPAATALLLGKRDTHSLKKVSSLEQCIRVTKKLAPRRRHKCRTRITKPMHRTKRKPARHTKKRTKQQKSRANITATAGIGAGQYATPVNAQQELANIPALHKRIQAAKNALAASILCGSRH